MHYSGTERRKYPALRNHVQALLTDGAKVKSRDPLQLTYKGQEITARHGILMCEPTPRELVDALGTLAGGEAEHRVAALQICLQQLDAALAPYPPFRPIRLRAAEKAGPA